VLVLVAVVALVVVVVLVKLVKWDNRLRAVTAEMVSLRLLQVFR
jgi:uncharacterized protein involved in outer membrane biogenesis